ncbi:MAG: hypothetical protein KDC87_01765 [Planctomycetes bacterium]|nr:hypothetical protein [Planctomycetota bacterium]MCB9889746.1 hypothetical protein [Planctomycetota bacterium]
MTPLDRVRLGASALVLALLGSCVTTEVDRPRVDGAELARHEGRLLTPFNQGNLIVCDKLEVEVNAVFGKHVGTPAGAGKVVDLPEAKETSWRSADPVRFQTHNISTARQSKYLVVPIGNTMFYVGDTFTRRVLHRAAPTLTAQATGHVMVTKDGKTPYMFESLRIADGRVQTRTGTAGRAAPAVGAPVGGVPGKPAPPADTRR